VRSGLTQAAGECARLLAGSKGDTEAAGRLASLARAARESGQRQASLAVIEASLKAGLENEAWDWLAQLDKDGFADGSWMKRVVPGEPPAGPRRDLRARWLKAP
ncbi:MAG: hypothetical protein ACKO9Z_08910, partial [Planctomycetota bacterium]